MNNYKKFTVDDNMYLFNGDTMDIFNIKSNDDILKYTNFEELNDTSNDNIFLRTICLVLNNSCNLACKYCFANKGMYDNPNKQMSFEKIKIAVDTLAKSLMRNSGNKINIAFFRWRATYQFFFNKRNC